MKFRNLFMTIVAGACMLASCDLLEQAEDLLPSIKLDPTELTFDAAEGSQSVNLTATLDWTVTTSLDGSWVALGSSKGSASSSAQTISVSVEANDGYDRSVDIVFSIGLAKATLTVNQKGSQGTYQAEEGDGSVDSPYNVEQAAAAVADLTWTSTTEYDKVGPYYVKGKVASIKEAFSADYGNGTFTISDDGSAAGVQLTAYRVYYLNNQRWQTGNTQIEVGDVVVVYGELMNYMGNTPETVQKGSYLYSLNGVTEPTGGQSVDYSAAEAKTIAEFIAAADGSTYYKITGEVYGSINTQYGNFNIKDSTGSVYVYGVSNWSEWSDKVVAGTTVTIAGTYKQYNDTDEMVNGYILAAEGGTQVDYNSVAEKTVAEFISLADTENYYKLSGTVSGFNASYCSFDLSDDSGTIYVYSVDNKADWTDKIKDGGTVTLAGKYAYYSAKSQHEVVNAQILSFEEGEVVEEEATGSGTLEDPYNPKAAYDAAAALEANAVSEEDVYVKGIISYVKNPFDANYGTAIFNITADGTTTATPFTCYSVYYLGNRSWEEGDAQVAVGDEVIVCGKITNFSGSVPEFASKKAYIYSLNGQTSIEQSPVFGVAKTAITVAASAMTATINVTGNVAWAATCESGAAISPESGEGAGEITVSFDPNQDTENTKEYTVVVSTEADVDVKSYTVTITQGKASTGDVKTITFDIAAIAEENSWANGTKYTEIELEGVTLTASGGSNTGKYYTSGNEWRFYQTESPSLTISSTSELVSAQFIYNSANGGILVDSTGVTWESESEVELSGLGAFSVANTGSATNGQVRFTKIIVTVAQ